MSLYLKSIKIASNVKKKSEKKEDSNYYIWLPINGLNKLPKKCVCGGHSRIHFGIKRGTKNLLILGGTERRE